MTSVFKKMIKPELEGYLRNCNFSDEEERIFMLLVKGKTITEVSVKVGLSTRAVSRRINNIKDKMRRKDERDARETERAYLA